MAAVSADCPLPTDPKEILALARFRSHIERALVYAGATHTFDDVLELIAAGKVQAWPGPASVVVTEIASYPRHSTLNIWLAGGNLAEIEAMEPAILAWGKAQGCTTATFTGRTGWGRPLAKLGWAPVLTMFAKPL